MTATDDAALRKLVKPALSSLQYGNAYDQRRKDAKTLVEAVPGLLDANESLTREADMWQRQLGELTQAASRYQKVRDAEVKRLSDALTETQAVLKAVAEHVCLMDSEIGDHQTTEYDVNDHDETYRAAFAVGQYAEHEQITHDLLALLDNDATRLATGVTCQPGQPWSCGDAHTAGHCVRPDESAPANTADEPKPTVAVEPNSCEHARASSQHVECPECGAELVPPCHCPDAFLDNGVPVPYCLRHGTPAVPPADEQPSHTVWDHYGPCGYCGVTTGPCLNPDYDVPWPTERKMPAPKPHPSRQLAASLADDPPASNPAACIAADPDHAGMSCDQYDAALDREPDADEQPDANLAECQRTGTCCTTCYDDFGSCCTHDSGPVKATHPFAVGDIVGVCATCGTHVDEGFHAAPVAGTADKRGADGEPS